jgi:hypothetical protein
LANPFPANLLVFGNFLQGMAVIESTLDDVLFPLLEMLCEKFPSRFSRREVRKNFLGPVVIRSWTTIKNEFTLMIGIIYLRLVFILREDISTVDSPMPAL